VRRTRTSGPMLLLALLLSIDAKAEPLDLLDPTPRTVEVAFEVSPRDQPTQTDTVYTPPLVGFLEPGEAPGTARVTIDRSEIESVLLAGHGAVPGSVSDFVWVFDTATGDVLSTSLTGRLTKELDWGLFRSSAEARIDLDMQTRRVGGAAPPRSWLGQQLFHYCDDPTARGCEVVAGQRLDRATGYVYAVGTLNVHFGQVTLRTFSPLGEAIFAEIDDAGRESLASPALAAPAASTAVTEASGRAALPAVSAAPPHP